MKAANFLLLLALAATAPRGSAAGNASRELGDAALAGGLWEVAASHYRSSLEAPDLPPAQREQIVVRLAETHVRARQPAEALALLADPLVAQTPGAAFWKAQAIAGTGRLAEAVELFAALVRDPTSPHRQEAAFTLANLLLALERPEEALAALTEIANSDPAAPSAPESIAIARLRAAAILLDLGRTNEAAEMLPDVPDDAPSLRSFAALLEARLQASAGNHEAAAALFLYLIENPTGQTLRRHHLAVLGLADARAALGDPAAASAGLLTFLQQNPEQPLPLLPAIFDRILGWLPERPAPNDPLFTRLGEWVPEFVPPATGLIASHDHGAAGAWPAETKSGELTPYAIDTLAVARSRTGSPEDQAIVRRLLQRLRWQYPAHPLAGRALYQEAAMAIDGGDPARASSILDALQESSAPAELRGKAAFLEAARNFRDGNFPAAARWFAQAAENLPPPAAQTAEFNSAIATFESDDAATIPITVPDSQKPSPDIELERALTLDDPSARRTAIEAFLGTHPDHPRVPEARLAAAEAALATAEPDVSFAKAQLDTIAEEPANLDALPASRIDWVRLRIADLTEDRDTAIALARAIVESQPPPPEAPEAAYLLGRNLFEAGDYNDARLVVEKLASTDPDPDRSQAAWLLAARSAALVPTAQSQQEALGLFDKAIASGGTVTAVARLEKARLLIDLNLLAEAEKFLRPWYEETPDDDPLHLPAGLLLAEAIGRQGGSDPASLSSSLAIYDELLAGAGKFSAIFNRLQFERGRALEMLPDPADPSKTREPEAFTAYYSVLETDQAPAEWHYFESCGFRALTLLEKAGRWPAAVACARKIASFQGPRADEAARRAEDLRLKYMIWED